jgi:hypothetical protein
MLIFLQITHMLNIKHRAGWCNPEDLNGLSGCSQVAPKLHFATNEGFIGIMKS